MSWVEQQNFTREQQFEFISAIYLTLAKDDPISAIYDAESIANTDLKSYVVDSILAFWGQHEPLSAIAWIDQRERPDFYTQIKAQLILLLIEISPSSASEYILNMPTSEMKYHSISQYAHSLTLIDIDQALNWVAMIDENEAYQAALTPILELAASLPDYQMRALEIALEQKDQAFRDTLIESLSIQLAAVNIDAVINVHAQLPDSVNKTVTGIIAQQLLEHNINEAKNWINSLPINNSSDYAKRIIGEHLMSTDWQGSLKIAEEISNPVERFSLIEQTILYINQKNPSQAQMLLDKLPDLTNDEITRLKNQLQNNN